MSLRRSRKPAANFGAEGRGNCASLHGPLEVIVIVDHGELEYDVHDVLRGSSRDSCHVYVFFV